MPFSDKSLVEHQKQNQTHPDNEVRFRFRCLARFSMLKKFFRQIEDLIQGYPFFSKKLSFLVISLCYGKKVTKY